jgi:hypothetical protein
VIDLGMTALATLIPISVLIGIGILLVFRRTSDQTAVRRAKSLVTAHLLEFRLFMDEPRLILRAQRDLIVANLHFLRLMLWPVVVLALPMVLLLGEMDAFYGRAPLVAGQPAILTAQLRGVAAGEMFALRAPAGIAVESPGIRVPAEHQVSWRIRPLRATTAELELVHGDRVVRKSIAAGKGMRYLSERRASLAGLLLHPAERPLLDRDIDWIEINYPDAHILHLHWMVWFFVISGVTALLLKRKFRTAF